MRRTSDIDSSTLGRHGTTLRDIADDLDSAEEKIDRLSSDLDDVRAERDKLQLENDELTDRLNERED